MFGVNISIFRSLESFRIFFGDKPIKEAHCQKSKRKKKKKLQSKGTSQLLNMLVTNKITLSMANLILKFSPKFHFF
jgi:hypothetical protein